MKNIIYMASVASIMQEQVNLKYPAGLTMYDVFVNVYFSIYIRDF